MSEAQAMSLPRRLADWRERRGLAWADLIVPVALAGVVIASALASDTFLTEANLKNLMRQIVTNGLISLGMLVVILTGGIDLSVGAVVALAGIVVAELQSTIPTPVAIAVAIGAALLVGAVNGGIIARFAIAPFIVTLGTLSAVRGAVYVFSETPVTPTDPAFMTIGSAFWGPLPAIFVFMLACYLVISLFLSRTTPGRAIIAIGGNQEAVRLAGIDVRAHIVLAYVIGALFAGIAGVILASRVGISQPSVAIGFELDAIAACVIGGAVLGGGAGSVRGTLLGVVVLGLISNLLNLYDVQSYYQQIFKGALIIIAVLGRRKES
jgi:ribose/xylose/arabinose/galactoside ABC-type transport system permease subunit